MSDKKDASVGSKSFDILPVRVAYVIPDQYNLFSLFSRSVRSRVYRVPMPLVTVLARYNQVLSDEQQVRHVVAKCSLVCLNIDLTIFACAGRAEHQP